MRNEQVQNYYIEKDHNCAESTLLIANDLYKLGLTQEEMKLVSGFGGGFGCEGTCGALCGSIAVLGKMCVDGRAHATEGFKDICANYVKRFEEELGSTCCAELKKKYFVEGCRCKETVVKNLALLEAYIAELKKERN